MRITLDIPEGIYSGLHALWAKQFQHGLTTEPFSHFVAEQMRQLVREQQTEDELEEIEDAAHCDELSNSHREVIRALEIAHSGLDFALSCLNEDGILFPDAKRADLESKLAWIKYLLFTPDNARRFLEQEQAAIQARLNTLDNHSQKG